MVNPWFKFYGGEYLGDPKIASLTPAERSCWVTLLSLASNSSEPGVVQFLTIDALLQKSGVIWDPYDTEEWDNCKVVLDKFVRMKMIEKSDDGTITILNWKKRQETNLTDAERAKSYRDRQKERHANVTRHVTNVTQEENRIDKNRLNTSESSIRIEKVTEKEETPKERKDTSYLKVFELWGDYPKNWKVNTTEISAAKNLLEELDIEDIKRTLKYYQKVKDIPYAPLIVKPSDLDRKWDNLLAFKTRQHA